MRVWKRLCAVVIVCLFACGMLPAASADDLQQLTDENGYTYHLSESEKAIVLTGYTGTDIELTLPHEIDGKPVTIISGFHADNGSQIQKVVIPNSVRIIERSFFKQFTVLHELILPDSLFAITLNSFTGCTALRNVRLPLGLHMIDWSFRDCPDLRFEAYPLTYDRLLYEQERIDIIPYPYTTGDLNADNQINTTDARLLLQAAVDKLTLSDEQAAVADVNGDGVSDTTDARLVLQYAVGKTDGFKAEIMPDVPLIDPDDPNVTVVQTSTPYGSMGMPQQLDPPVSVPSPRVFLRVLESIMSTPGRGVLPGPLAQYYVSVKTKTESFELLFFTHDENGSAGLRVAYEGCYLGYGGGSALLPYLT